MLELNKRSKGVADNLTEQATNSAIQCGTCCDAWPVDDCPFG
jgi:hypothetical protein